MSDSTQPVIPPCAVIDIDGVLADVRHRLHFLESRPRDWVAFFAAADVDPLLEPGRSALETALAEQLSIVYLTGRPERCRQATEDWLARHGLPRGPLMMRPDRDRRPARVYKVEALRRLQDDGDIAYLLDDDLDVAAAVRVAGFTVRVATWMATEPHPALREAQEMQGRT
jgi:hypothetical protein